MELVFGGCIIPVFNDDIIAEYREVLNRAKFHFNEAIVDDFVGSIIEVGLSIEAEPLNIDFKDPKDKVFYEITMEEMKKNDTYLVTGNIKHFPKKHFIVTPRQMLEIISG